MTKPLNGIDTVIVRVSGVAKSKTWYQEKLDLQPVYEDPIHKLVVLDTDSPTSLTIWQSYDISKPDKERSTYPIFRTLNASEAREKLMLRGVAADELVTDHAVTYFRFYDLDGNVAWGLSGALKWYNFLYFLLWKV